MFAQDQLFIRQRKEWVEILVSWETGNKYEILSSTRETLAYVVERRGGFGRMLLRGILRSHRSMEVDVFGPDRATRLLHFSRPFFWFFSDLEVRTAEGDRQGSVHRRWGRLHKIYDLRDEAGVVFARIESPIWRLWTFPIVGTRSRITKKWGGGLREVFTDADTFLVDFAGESWTRAQRAVILAAAISIDFDYFENNQGSSGVLSVFE